MCFLVRIMEVTQIKIERPLYEHDQLRQALDYEKPKKKCKLSVIIAISYYLNIKRSIYDEKNYREHLAKII